MHHVAVLYDVVFSFQTEPAGVARARFAVAGDVVVIGDGLGADEAMLEIGVNNARRLRRPGALRHRPGPCLLRPGGEEGDEAEERIAGADQTVEAWFVKAEARQKLFAFAAW